MQIIASKFIYLKDQNTISGRLKIFKHSSIQLSFFQKKEFFKINHKFLKETCEALNIQIPTVHAPTVDIFDNEFLESLELIKKIYKVGLISIHPQKGELGSALNRLEKFAKKIEDLEVILAYENFPTALAKRKWICLSYQMYSEFNQPFLKLTFDTSHLDSPKDCIQEFENVFQKVAVVHLSDSKGSSKHIPLGRGRLPYKKFLEKLITLSFKGPIVLEYLSEFEEKLIEDLKKLKEDYERINSGSR